MMYMNVNENCHKNFEANFKTSIRKLRKITDLTDVSDIPDFLDIWPTVTVIEQVKVIEKNYK